MSASDSRRGVPSDAERQAVAARKLARALRDYAIATHDALPDDVAVQFSFPGGKRVPLSISRRELSIAAAGPAGAAIVEVIEALDIGELLSGEEIAERAGYPYSSWFAQILSQTARDCTVYCAGKKGFGRHPT